MFELSTDQALLESIADAVEGQVSDGQGNGVCPVCGKHKFRFIVGQSGHATFSCQSGACQSRSITDLDPQWLRLVRDHLVAHGLHTNRLTAPWRPEESRLDLPSGDDRDRWAHNLIVLIDSGREVYGLTAEQAVELDLGWNWSSDRGLGRLVCEVINPQTDDLDTVIYRSLDGVAPKSRVQRGTSDRHLYAPSGIDSSLPVVLVGGEKDVITAYAMGYGNVACFTNGDGPPRDPDRAAALTGCDVILAGDLDATDKTEQLATFLLSSTKSVRIADLAAFADRLPAKGDVHDLLTSSHLGIAAFEKLVADAMPWSESDGEVAQHEQLVRAQAARVRIRRDAARLVDAQEADRYAITLPRLTLLEALEAPRPDAVPYRLDDLHVVGHNSTIAAQFKTGKTTLGGNMLRSLVDGDDFLDRFPVLVPDGRVGLLNYELTDSDMLDWLDDQGIEHLDRIALANLRGVPFALTSERNQQELIDWCRDQDVQVLHVDPHRRAFQGFGSENSNDDVNAFTDVLDVVKREANVRDLFLYVHSGRVKGDVGSEHARGATALDDWADNRWILTREGGDRFLYADGRAGFTPEFRLSFDPGSRRLTAEEGNRRDYAARRYTSEVLNALEAAAGSGALVGELEERLSVKKKGSLKASLDALVQQGSVVQRKEGNAKRTWLKEYVPGDDT